VLVPCCQAEVAAVLRQKKNETFGKTPLSELWRHPIHTREFGSQLTNVLRCLQLEARGYQLTVTELVGWEHSMKNELIIAKKTGKGKQSAREQQEAILHELNLEDCANALSTERALAGRYVPPASRADAAGPPAGAWWRPTGA
jgi:hypothetical protein